MRTLDGSKNRQVAHLNIIDKIYLMNSEINQLLLFLAVLANSGAFIETIRAKVDFQGLGVQYKYNLTFRMSRSQPKPKIIYKTLQSLIKSSSLKKANCFVEHQQEKQRILPLQFHPPEHRHECIQISTRQSSDKRQKIKRGNQSKLISSKMIKNKLISTQRNQQNLVNTLGHYDEQINKVYEEMQEFLLNSKENVLKSLKQQNGIKSTEAKVKQLQKMSDYLKQIINVFTSENHLKEQSKALGETTKCNLNLSELSKNQKKKNSLRHMQTEAKKITVYQKLLKRDHA